MGQDLIPYIVTTLSNVFHRINFIYTFFISYSFFFFFLGFSYFIWEDYVQSLVYIDVLLHVYWNKINSYNKTYMLSCTLEAKVELLWTNLVWTIPGSALILYIHRLYPNKL